MSPNTARIQCYAAIKDCVRASAMSYLEARKSNLSDAMAQEVVKESLAAMECIFKVLDGYDIQERRSP